MSSTFVSTSEFRKKKEIEEARKAGTLPPEKDEEGNLINPHNPEYITKRPWYLGEGPSLKHQGIQKADHLLSISEADSLYLRGKKKINHVRWRKGSCKNCGAMTHKVEDCVERPRSRGAWKTNNDLKDDEVFIDVRSEQYGKLAFDAKRDQWLGYNPEDHKETVDRYGKIDMERRKKKMEDLENKFSTEPDNEHKKYSRSGSKKKIGHEKSLGDDGLNKSGNSDDSDSDSDYESDAGSSEDEEFKDRDGGAVISKRVGRQGGVGGAEMKTTVRNLRIREDTAKYLRNLDPNSAYYDPKTRSMRDNPNPNVNPEELAFAGDNFIRFSGDTKQLAQTQLFTWEASEKGSNIHPLATPSQVEFLRKQYEEKKALLEKTRKKEILDKYGGEIHLQVPPKEILLAQSEHYVEYSYDGRIIKGQERAPVKSKYIEDVFENNHTHIWGSYFDKKSFSWGYACCHSLIRKSYCTGEAGKEANEVTNSSIKATERLMLKPNANPTASHVSKHELFGEQLAPVLDNEKLKKAMQKEKNFQKKEIETDERKRKYNSMGSYEVTAEEMEAYRMSKRRTEDPMANIL